MVMGNMSCGHLVIMMDHILLVPDITPSSHTFLHNHLSLQISHTFIMLGPWL